MSNSTAIVQCIQTKGLGAATLNRLLRRLQQENRPLDDFILASTNEMINDYGLKDTIARQIKNLCDEAEWINDKLYENDIKTAYIGMKEYPERLLKILEKDTPPVIFYKGNFRLLERKSVGFCGARNASGRGIEITRRASKGIAEKDVNIISQAALTQAVKKVYINIFMNNIEQTKVLIGHPMFYGNVDNFFKRMTGLTGTKKIVNTDKLTNNFIDANLIRQDGKKSTDYTINALR